MLDPSHRKVGKTVCQAVLFGVAFYDKMPAAAHIWFTFLTSFIQNPRNTLDSLFIWFWIKFWLLYGQNSPLLPIILYLPYLFTQPHVGCNLEFEMLWLRRHFQKRKKHLTLKFWLMKYNLWHVCKGWEPVSIVSSGSLTRLSFFSLLITLDLQSVGICLASLS